MEDLEVFNLVGFYHFTNKDQTKTYYIAQIATNKIEGNSNKKCVLVNVFVDSDTYAEISCLDIGTEINVKITPNFETGKISYKIVL